jgi:hypothetical protein
MRLTGCSGGLTLNFLDEVHGIIRINGSICTFRRGTTLSSDRRTSVSVRERADDDDTVETRCAGASGSAA